MTESPNFPKFTSEELMVLGQLAGYSRSEAATMILAADDAKKTVRLFGVRNCPDSDEPCAMVANHPVGSVYRDCDRWGCAKCRPS